MHSTPAQAVRALRLPDQRGMGRAVTPETGIVTVERIDQIEAVTTSVSAWNPMIIPGLLQTSRYAAGAIAMARPSLPATVVQRLARQRSDRCAAFFRRRQEVAHLSAWFIIGEAAITQPLQNAHAHADQIRHLLDLAVMDRIEVQILRADRPTPGRTGQFTLYKLEPATGDDLPTRLGYLETPVGAWYTQRVEDIARLHSAFCDMMDAALTQRDTIEYLKEVHAQWVTVSPEQTISSPGPGSGSPATPTPGTVWKSPGPPPGR